MKRRNRLDRLDPLSPKTFACIALLGAVGWAGGASADDLASAAAAAEKAPSIVSVKYVLKRGEHEMPRTVPGAMVDASGLAVCSTSSLGTGAGGHGKASATGVKILFGSDPKEYESVLVAQDTKLDLAFVQVLDLEGRQVVPLDLSKAGSVEIGTTVWQVMRKRSGFDFAAVVGTGYVTSRVEKPRPLWGLSGDARMPGLPLFDGSGAILGIVARQQGAEGGDDGPRGAFGTFLLPLDQVSKSLEDARKRVPEAVEKAKAAREKEKEATPATPAMDDAPKEPPPEPAKPADPAKPGEGK